jgi:hypothetical protein
VAVEIPLREKYRVVTNGRQKGGSNNSHAAKVRTPLRKEDREAAQRATAENRMVKVLVGGRKVRWMSQQAWEAMDHGAAVAQ